MEICGLFMVFHFQWIFHSTVIYWNWELVIFGSQARLREDVCVCVCVCISPGKSSLDAGVRKEELCKHSPWSSSGKPTSSLDNKGSKSHTCESGLESLLKENWQPGQAGNRIVLIKHCGGKKAEPWTKLLCSQADRMSDEYKVGEQCGQLMVKRRHSEQRAQAVGRTGLAGAKVWVGRFAAVFCPSARAAPLGECPPACSVSSHVPSLQPSEWECCPAGTQTWVWILTPLLTGTWPWGS